MVLHYDQETFYKLPDWEKLKLKRSRSKYRGYRIMTQDQEENRKGTIYDICAHFGMTTIDDLDDDAFSTMKNFWPNKIEYFITPKVLDYFSSRDLCKFGYCSYCIHYDGYLKNSKIKSNIIPFKGVCTFEGKDIVPHDARCCSWELGNFHIQLMYVFIEKKLEHTEYNFSEFVKDLENFNFWNYFFFIN